MSDKRSFGINRDGLRYEVEVFTLNDEPSCTVRYYYASQAEASDAVTVPLDVLGSLLEWAYRIHEEYGSPRRANTPQGEEGEGK